MNKGLLIVVSGPSGVGKGTVLGRVLADDNNFAYSVSCTTRKPREGEIDGVHYHFITNEEFEANIKNGKMLEYAGYCDNYYGTNADYVDTYRNKGKDVVLEIDTQGARQIKEKCPDSISIFIAPPSVDELRTRLINRGTEDEATINKRVQRALFELNNMHEYDYVIINDVIEDAAQKTKAIIDSARIKNNKTNLIEEVLKNDVISGN